MITRVVFDTNILISALLSLTGAPFRCVALARAGIIQSITCAQILDEFAEKLQTKFAFREDRAWQATEEIRAISQFVTAPGTLRIVSDDPDDDVVIECALVGEASIVISGDKHLRAMKQYKDVQILTASEFLLLRS